MDQPKDVSWQKVLWKRQPYPDNYTGTSFLNELVVNANVPQRDFWTVAFDSAAVTQQLCTVVAAAAIPLHLLQGTVSTEWMMIVCVALLGTGYLTCLLLGGHFLGGTLLRGLKQGALLTGGVYLLCPLLHSLARTISSDSVVAMTAGLLLLHLYLHDYNFINSVTDKLTGTVSLGAAVFSSVLVASSMRSEKDVFVHVLFSLELFLLSPFMRRYICRASPWAHILLTGAMVVAGALLLYPLSPPMAGAFLMAVAAISLVCPWCLVSFHKFKAKINGPWDEALPQISMSITT